jgi:hypothetical protein
MPITVDVLKAAGSRYTGSPLRTLSEARVAGPRATAFLCHSHKDQDLAKGLVTLLAEAGWRVYVDWADAEMPETPNRETAKKIQEKIVGLYYFLFLATANSMASRWCPWEIGYADGKKPLEQIFVIPTINGGRTHGNEYLQLYRRIDFAAVGQLSAFSPGLTSGTVLKTL